MAGGGRFKIKGGIASKGEAEVIDGAILVTVDGGLPSVPESAVEHSFKGSESGAATSVDLMQEGTELGLGLPILKDVDAGAVGVSVIHDASPDSGSWTLRLWRRTPPATTFTQVATFTFDT